MGKDFFVGLGAAELNALMSMQLQKLSGIVAKMNKLYADHNILDVNTAYSVETLSDEFIEARDKLLNELAVVTDTMNKIRSSQQACNS